MPGYLLDTNHITAWEEKNPTFIARFRDHPHENILWVCPIALAEIEWGLRVTITTNTQRRADCRRFIEDEMLDFVWTIDTTTKDAYAQIMELIWRKYPPGSGRIETQHHLCTLGVDVNDVWIAAVALERGLILLTNDDMETIRDCVPDLRVANWLE
jgi:tRNA(fMet)-specific endonuclease VapC